jgi:hypothetical protein
VTGLNVVSFDPLFEGVAFNEKGLKILLIKRIPTIRNKVMLIMKASFFRGCLFSRGGASSS